ncbi:MAG: substrate-binding domain-containing protein [Burkholderiales bacterium]
MAKKLVVFLLAFAMVAVMFAACTQAPATASEAPSEAAPASEAPSEAPPASEAPAEGKTVGLTMPTKSLQRWNEDGANVKAALEAKGYKVDLQYADNKQDVQNTQIENQITMGVDILVIASIDGGALGGVLEQAKAANIPVIAYDRLLTNTDKCDYYATFDNYGVGKMQAEALVSALGLDKGEKGPFNIEIFGGSPDDNNAHIIHKAHMDVIQQYIDSGALIITSGQTTMEQIGIQAWDPATAQARMDNLLTAYYADKDVKAVLCSNDSTAHGVIASLKGSGYGTADKPYPIVTGQDCDKINLGHIARGEQYMSIFKDTRILADEIVKMVDAILSGKKAETNTTYDNGVIKEVPTLGCKLQLVTKDNWKQVVIDSGYYKIEDIPVEETE